MTIVTKTVDPLIVQLLQNTDAIDSSALAAIYDNILDQPDLHAALVATGLVNDEQIADAYSSHYLLPRFQPPQQSFKDIDQSVANLLPAAFCARHRIVPLADDGVTLEIAIDCPEGLLLADDIRFHTGRQMRAMFATASVVTAGIVDLYGMGELDDSKPFEFLGKPKEPVVKSEPVASSGDEPIDWLIARVVQLRADSVLIQQNESSFRLRFRIDGQLTELSPPSSIKRLIESIDGVTDWKRGGPVSIDHATSCGKIQIRVHRCETAGGQSWTLQFFHGPVAPPRFEDLAISSDDRIDFLRGIHKTRGITIVAGPSDSGKSDTIYAALAEIEDPSLSIFTVEQSLRYKLPGIVQTIVDDVDQFGLHDHLENILSQSPDVLMVHQIRDAATADLCVRVAEGGRRVLATLPSADCNSALRHLESLGVSANRIGQTVRSVVAQRRMRRLCDHCKKPQDVSSAARQRLGISDAIVCYQGGGCQRCMGSGYHGRLTAYEVMRLNSRGCEKLSSYDAMKDVPPVDSDGVCLRRRMLKYVVNGETSLGELRKRL